MEYPKVFAISLNWNGKNDTIECVEALKRMNYPNYYIVIVDNGSIDGSVAALKEKFPDIIIIENGNNLGYADGFNNGLKFAFENGADYFLIVNNDTVIDSEALINLVKTAEMDERIGFVSGKVYWHDKPDTLQTIGRMSHPVTLVDGPHVGSGEVDRGQYDKIQDFDFIDDVFLLARREVYKSVGGYDSHFFLYYEETDWCARVRKAGFKIRYTPYAKIWHKGNIGGPDGDLSPKRHYYLCRNQIIFMKRNASPSQFLRFMLWLFGRQSLDAARRAKHGQFRHIFARLHGIASSLVWLFRELVKGLFCSSSINCC